MNRFSPDLLGRMGRVAARIHHRLDQRHVQECQEMVELCPFDWDPKGTVKGMYESLWQIPSDLVRFDRLNDEQLAQNIEGLDDFLKLMEQLDPKKGVVFVAAHLGPWELCAQTISRRFRPVISIYKPAKQEFINRFFEAARHRHRQSTVPKDGGMLPLFKHLKRGGAVGLVIDQHGGSDGVESEFLGRPCSSWDSAVLLASKTDSPIVPVSLIRQGRGYKFLHREAIEAPAAKDKIKDLLPWVKRVDEALSSMVAEAPEQWMWLGRRWGRDFKERMSSKLKT